MNTIISCFIIYYIKYVNYSKYKQKETHILTIGNGCIAIKGDI